MDSIILSKNTLINKVYLGLRSDVKTETANERAPVSSMGSFRSGFLVTHYLLNKFAIESQAVLEYSNISNTISLPSFEFMYSINSNLQVRAGHLVTPTTTTRPNPIAWQSQVETYAQSRIIGSRPGVMLRHTLSSKVFVATSLHYQDGQWVPHGRIDYKAHRLAGYYQNDSTFFASLKSSIKKLDGNFNYNKTENEFAASLFFNINSQYALYTDVNRKFNQHKTDVLIIGSRSYFNSTKLPIAGFFGVYYDLMEKYVAGQFFIHLMDNR